MSNGTPLTFGRGILKDLGSRKNLTTIAEVGLAAISISDRAQFVREIFSSAISRRNRVPPEYIPTPGIDSSRMPKKASTETK